MSLWNKRKHYNTIFQLALSAICSFYPMQILQAASIFSSASSTSLCLMFRGGSNRTIFSPAGTVKTPSSCNALTNWIEEGVPAFFANSGISAAPFNRIPNIQPMPWTPSITFGYAVRNVSPISFFRKSPLVRALKSNSSFLILHYKV